MPPRLWSLLFFLLLRPISAASAAATRGLLPQYVTEEDIKAAVAIFADAAAESSSSSSTVGGGDPAEWDEFFVDPDTRSDQELDQGNWRYAFEPPLRPRAEDDDRREVYWGGVYRMISSVAAGNSTALEEAVGDIEENAAAGFPDAQSTAGFLYGAGILRPRSSSRAFLYHQFAADAGNMQSKLALAYSYYRQEMYKEAVVLYRELAEAAVSSFLIANDQPSFEMARIYDGGEENKEVLRKLHGEEDEAFQVIEHQATRGDAGARYRMGMFYFHGYHGLKPDVMKAMMWFMKAAIKGEPRSMVMLGEIYARDVGFGRNYSDAFSWLSLASQHKYAAAYNGLGYLYLRGYGVEKKNYTKAREYFEKAANNRDAGGHYNLGMVYLKGIGVKKDILTACKHLFPAADAGHLKALYQVAKLLEKGIILKRDLTKAIEYYKEIAERGPWISISRWALQSYIKGEVGKALFLYLRMSELGYEVAQCNSAWILDKYAGNIFCVGESGSCSHMERHLRAHTLWWQASEQGNVQAALLIGDAYYYGRQGTERDYERAAEAYMLAKSKSNAQALFNLGYMHEHGKGLPPDLHMAKRYYDEALRTDSSSRLPVTLALASLWIRKNYADSFMVHLIDSLPQVLPRVQAWLKEATAGEENATILALFVCLLTVLYLRERRRRPVANPLQHAGDELG